MPDVIQTNHEWVVELFQDNPAWAFWLRFYEGMWDGTFDDWDLALEVIAGIEEEDWEKGYLHVGEVIAGIEARLLADRTKLAEEIILDPETERFRSVPIPVENADLIQAIVEKVNDDLADALLGRNGLREN